MILLELEKGKIINEVVKLYHIGSEIRVGDETVAVALFDYIGQCLCDFVQENDLVSVPLPLGKLLMFYYSLIEKIDFYMFLIKLHSFLR